MDQLCIDLFFHYGINFPYREGGTRLAVTYFCVYYIWSALDYFAFVEAQLFLFISSTLPLITGSVEVMMIVD
jgi:hypothetical protein